MQNLTRRGVLAFPAALLPVPALAAATAAAPDFIALCYHEIGPDGRGSHASISQSRLVQHLAWLRETGRHAVRLDDLLAARDGRRPLPDRAVLLTFDDGYQDFYTRVLPMLRAFDMPAVVALVTSWMEAPAGSTFAYGNTAQPRNRLLSWAQAKEMLASGLIEFASHTHDLHHGILGNPQGNAQPAAVTRQFDPAVGYEDDTTWRRRIESDLARSADIIRRKLGRPPRALVWPYGRYNGDAVAIAARVGMPLTLTLNPEPGRLGGMDRIGRLLLMGDPSVGELERAMRFAAPQRERVLHVDLDHVHDDDPMQAARNLDALIERVARLGPSTVYLQAYADPDGDGVAEALYFPNRFLPMRADLFNRVAWQLSTRANVSVFAWMPLLAFRLGGDNDLVLVANDGPPAPASGEYRRLSPFAPRARDWILGLYEDLARHCQCAGLLFHDDAFLSDYEDANPAALRAYQAAGLPGDIAAIRADPAAMRRWTALKTSALIDLSRAAHHAAERWRAPLQTARNMYARPVLEPQSEAWFAQSLPAFVAAYDRVAIMAMPYMENAPDAGAFLRALYAAVANLPGAISKTVFELQAVDWRQRPAQPVPSARLRAQLRLLQQLGAHHIGWYPDDFLRGHPDAVIIGDAISARGFPWRP